MEVHFRKENKGNVNIVRSTLHFTFRNWQPRILRSHKKIYCESALLIELYTVTSSSLRMLQVIYNRVLY